MKGLVSWATAFLLCASAPVLSKSSPLQFGLPALARSDFNRLALQHNSPLFWQEDDNHDRRIDPQELLLVGLGLPHSAYVRRTRFTKRFEREYLALVDARRLEAVRRELDAGRPTVVYSDLRHITPPEKRMLRHLLEAAKLIDALYYEQTGAAAHLRHLPKLDPASKALFLRNNGPWCISPATRGDSFCNALSTLPPKRSRNYPIDQPHGESLCEGLRRHPESKNLLDPFVVVRRKGGQLVAVPYTRAYAPKMTKVSARLRAAAQELANIPREAALRRYLLAAASAFLSNDWSQADEAWVAMNMDNSGWYLRVGPDEVYQDHCQQKASFHLVLARVDHRSAAWKRRLNPRRNKMEQTIARLIGPPYKARKVGFQMPDFIHIVLNAGDSRHPLGATIGQSLPNWGPIAQQGRGRTIVMTNLYTDHDSQQVSRLQARALLARSTLLYYVDNSEPSKLATILHEAAHNFGPHSDYRVSGKSAAEIFGGKLASTLEELKAQTAGLWLLKLLRDEREVSQTLARQVYTKSLMWAFGHIARGMLTNAGNHRPYGQLAAIQVGYLFEQGALRFEGGKFTIRFGDMSRAIEKLLRRLTHIMVGGDVEAAKELVGHYARKDALFGMHAETIQREILRYPRASFRYSIRY